MNKPLPKVNLSLCLAEEYKRLISLAVLSDADAERMAKILEKAIKDDFLNCLIETIELKDYLKQT